MTVPNYFQDVNNMIANYEDLDTRLKSLPVSLKTIIKDITEVYLKQVNEVKDLWYTQKTTAGISIKCGKRTVAYVSGKGYRSESIAKHIVTVHNHSKPMMYALKAFLAQQAVLTKRLMVPPTGNVVSAIDYLQRKTAVVFGRASSKEERILMEEQNNAVKANREDKELAAIALCLPHLEKLQRNERKRALTYLITRNSYDGT